jgi:hypothetical protein
MRKSFNGLSNIVQYSLTMEAIGDAVYVFCNRRHDFIKILEWDGDGFWLHMKHLNKGAHFRWVDNLESPALAFSQEDLCLLLDSPGMELKLKRKELNLS